MLWTLHNSEYVGYYGDKEPKPFKLPLFIWLLWGICSLVPVINWALIVGVGLGMLIEWRDEYRLKKE